MKTIIVIIIILLIVNIALSIYRLVKSSEGFELAKPSPEPFHENFLKEHQFVSQLGNPVSVRLTFDKPPSNGAVVKIVRKGVSSCQLLQYQFDQGTYSSGKLVIIRPRTAPPSNSWIYRFTLEMTMGFAKMTLIDRQNRKTVLDAITLLNEGIGFYMSEKAGKVSLIVVDQGSPSTPSPSRSPQNLQAMFFANVFDPTGMGKVINAPAPRGPFFDQDKLGNWVIKWNGNVYTRS